MTVTNFIWDELGDNVLMETDDSGSVTAEYHNLPGEFGEPISRRVGFTEHYYHYDGLGSTRQLTNQVQTVTETYTYSAFGETVASTGSTTNPFQFNGASGYYRDAETGDYYVRRRTYSPSKARWLSRDPLRFVDGPNIYAVVRNRPIGGSDPSGTIRRINITPFSEGNCTDGGLMGIRFNWQLDNSHGPGWIVQKVTCSCTNLDCPQNPNDPPCPQDGGNGQIEFYEAWPVTTGNTSDLVGATGFNDTWSLTIVNNTCAAMSCLYETRFYRQHLRGMDALRLRNNGTYGGGWLTRLRLETQGGCVFTLSGPNQPYFDGTGGPPDLWSQSFSEVAHFSFEIEYSCCGGFERRCQHRSYDPSDIFDDPFDFPPSVLILSMPIPILH